MTIEETMDWCEQFRTNLVMQHGEARRYALALDAMRTCLDVLSSKVPLKAKLETCGELRRMECAICGAPVNRYDHRFCPRCGQAQDWSGEKQRSKDPLLFRDKNV